MPAARRARAARPAPAGRWRPALEVTAAVLLGALIGTGLAVLGARLLPDGPLLAPLTRTASVGIDPPLRVDLGVATFTLGLTLRVGALTLLGGAAGAWLWRRSRA